MMGELEFFPRAASTIKELDPDIQGAVSTSTNIAAVASSTIKEAEVASTQHHFIMAPSNILTSPTDFLGDTGASHHIAHRLDCFSKIFPLRGIFKIHQVQGTVTVTHWGTVILEVDLLGPLPFVTSAPLVRVPIL